MTRVRRQGLPGFGPSLGVTMFVLGGLVLLPLGALVAKAAGLSWSAFAHAALSRRTISAYELTLGASALASLAAVLLGGLLAWVLVRYRFPGRQVVDALVDLPFALPTAVAGISLTTLYAPHGWIGRLFAPLGIELAYTPVGIVLALVFLGIPFVVRTVQPVLQELESEVEEAAASLGASRWQTFRRVLVPAMRPALVTGFALSFARGLGEYGSVVFISGNMPFRTEVVPVLVMTRLEEFDYAGAAAIAVVMLAISFALLLGINFLQTRVLGRAHAS